MSDISIKESITAYADGELSKADELALLEQAAKNQDISRAIDREIRFKSFLKNKLKRVDAPKDFKLRINQELLKVRNDDLTDQIAPIFPQTQSTNPKLPGLSISYKWMAAAALITLTAMSYLFGWFSPQSNTSVIDEIIAEDSNQTPLSVEFLTFTHFSNHNGSLIEPSFSASSAAEAQQILFDKYGSDITVPELDGAQFAGVVYVDFHDGFHTPLLEYEVSDGDNIYIFAFEMENLDGHDVLSRESLAVSSILKHDDVFIRKYDSHDVVSWKWHNVWYSGISHHSGDVLAAMLPH